MVQTEAKASRVVAGFSSVLVLRLSRADSTGIESLTSAEHFPSLHTVFLSSQTPHEVVAWILQVRKLSSRGLGGLAAEAQVQGRPLFQHSKLQSRPAITD